MRSWKRKIALFTMVASIGLSNAYAADTWKVDEGGNGLFRLSGRHENNALSLSCYSRLPSFYGFALQLPQTDSTPYRNVRIILSVPSGAIELAGQPRDILTLKFTNGVYNLDGLIPKRVGDAILKADNMRVSVMADHKLIGGFLSFPLPSAEREDFIKKCTPHIDKSNPLSHNDLIPD